MNKILTLLAVLMLAIPVMALSSSELTVSSPFIEDFASDTNTWWNQSPALTTFGVTDTTARDEKALRYRNDGANNYQAITSVNVTVPEGDWEYQASERIMPSSSGIWHFNNLQVGNIQIKMEDYWDGVSKWIEIIDVLHGGDILGGAYVWKNGNAYWSYSTKYTYTVTVSNTGTTIDIVGPGGSIIGGPKVVSTLTTANMIDGNGNARLIINTINSDSQSPRYIDYVQLIPKVYPLTAWNPNPANGATGVAATSKLTWASGHQADKHNVYFGQSLSDVNESATPVSVLQSGNTCDPCGLEFNQSYYWRIDEVNTTDANVWTGDIWNFTVENKPVCSTISFPDLDENLSIDFNDFAVITGEWGKKAFACGKLQGDLNGDLEIDNKDIAILAGRWLDKANTRYVDTASTVGLDNYKVRVEFDKTTGKIVVLKNLLTNDNYLKDSSGDGNIFRAYVNTTQVPTVLSQGWPYQIQGPEGSLGGTLVDAKNCVLNSMSFESMGNGGILHLQMYNSGTGLTFYLDVGLEGGSSAVSLDLQVRNSGSVNRNVMMGIPYLTGLGLGNDRNTNLGVRLRDFGQARAPAWQLNGDLYGRGWNGQWNAVYDKTADEALGLIVKDADVVKKVFRRWAGGGMSVFYCDKKTLTPGQQISYPTAELIVDKGNWKPIARRYSQWFSSHFNLRPLPKFAEDLYTWGSGWFAEPGNTSFTSFTQMPEFYDLPGKYDVREWAMWWQCIVRMGKNDSYDHTDGIYTARSDLGGDAALRAGTIKLENIGRHLGLYMAGKMCRLDSPLFASGAVHPIDWLQMTYQGQGISGISIAACPGCVGWQNQISSECRRVLQDIGPKYIRIDEISFAYEPCWNPAHNHADPYRGASSVEFLRKIREAMDEVDPNVLLLTENPSELLHQYTNASLVIWSPGPEIAPLRISVPSYQMLEYMGGHVQSALQGSFSASTAARNADGWATDYHNSLWGPGLEWAPPCYSDPAGNGISGQWPDLNHMFFGALHYGSPTDIDPYVPAFNATQSEDWAGRMWTYDKYWLMVCGNRSAIRPATAIEVKLPELPAEATHAYVFDYQTLAMQEVPINRRADGIYMTLSNGFAAVFFPLPGCPPLIQIDGQYSNIQKGYSANITVSAFSPWEDAGETIVNVTTPAVDPSIQNLSLPANLAISVPSNISTGYYYIDIKGDCIPFKRWFYVSP